MCEHVCGVESEKKEREEVKKKKKDCSEVREANDK